MTKRVITIFGENKYNLFECSCDFNDIVIKDNKSHFDNFVKRAKNLLIKEKAEPKYYIDWSRYNFDKIEDIKNIYK